MQVLKGGAWKSRRDILAWFLAFSGQLFFLCCYVFITRRRHQNRSHQWQGELHEMTNCKTQFSFDTTGFPLSHTLSAATSLPFVAAGGVVAG